MKRQSLMVISVKYLSTVLDESRRLEPTPRLAPCDRGGEDGSTAMSLERLEKLERLRKAIARGTYHVDAVRIAEKMIAGSDGRLH